MRSGRYIPGQERTPPRSPHAKKIIMSLFDHSGCLILHLYVCPTHSLPTMYMYTHVDTCMVPCVGTYIPGQEGAPPLAPGKEDHDLGLLKEPQTGLAEPTGGRVSYHENAYIHQILMGASSHENAYMHGQAYTHDVASTSIQEQAAMGKGGLFCSYCPRVHIGVYVRCVHSMYASESPCMYTHCQQHMNACIV